MGACRGRKGRIEFDQPSAHVRRAGMVFEDPEQVPPVARAEAQGADRSRGRSGQALPEKAPDDLKTAAQHRIAPIAVVPGSPLLGHRCSSLSRVGGSLGGVARAVRGRRGGSKSPAESRGTVRDVVRVSEVVEETPSTVTLRFPFAPPAVPGQFVMVWLPGDDELPMSLSFTDGTEKGVTVKAMGDTSRRVLRVRPGDLVGIRGPYGRGFDLAPRRILVVAGGSGAAVLAPAAERAIARGSRVTVALGATTSSELLFEGRFRSMGADVVTATDDGSAGVRGFITGPAEELLGSGRFEAVWTCGPEVMMVKVVESAKTHRVPAYGSVERHMKCALGMCDACAFGPFHVCTDGPVFDVARLAQVPEFGKFHRDPSGRPVPF
jgi:dihydroorotate dehydrogenase electron transfer subunit